MLVAAVSYRTFLESNELESSGTNSSPNVDADASVHAKTTNRANVVHFNDLMTACVAVSPERV